MSTYVVVEISPETTTRPVLTSVSQATRPCGSSRMTASRTPSEIWSATLSGCPSVTDPEVNRYSLSESAGVFMSRGSVQWASVSGPETPSPVGWFRRPSFFGHPVPAFEHALVADVMRAGLITCQPETRLRGVAQAMAANHVHTIVVVDPGSDSWRVIHDIDLLRTAAQSPDGRAIDVAADPVTIPVDAPATRAAELMAEQ